jgi:uncharacterized protein YndB with AHSA1/START domain
MDARTSTVAEAGERELVITRIIDALRHIVFEAWTEPDRVARWWGPQGFTTVYHDMTIRPGGAFRFCMRSPEGTEYWKQGVYREVVEPERLVFTFAWEDADGKPSHQTLVISPTRRQDGHPASGGLEVSKGATSIKAWTGALERFAGGREWALHGWIIVGAASLTCLDGHGDVARHLPAVPMATGCPHQHLDGGVAHFCAWARHRSSGERSPIATERGRWSRAAPGPWPAGEPGHDGRPIQILFGMIIGVAAGSMRRCHGDTLVHPASQPAVASRPVRDRRCGDIALRALAHRRLRLARQC